MNMYFLIAVYVLFPAVILYLCYRYPLVNKISPVAIAYISGFVWGNAGGSLGFFPENFMAVQTSISDASVAIALPLLLFSLDIRNWARLAGKALLSMLLAVIAIVIVATILFFVYKSRVADAWHLSGMAAALYTGGTPNLAAIKTALGVDTSRFVLMHTYDTVISMIYILFTVTIAQRFFLLFLPPFKKTVQSGLGKEQNQTEDIQLYVGIFGKKSLVTLAAALGISLLIVGVSFVVSIPFSKEMATAIIILAITTMGIAASLVPAIHNMEKTFQFGMYLIYMFCFVVGSMVNYDMIVNIDYHIMFFVIISIAGSMAVHAVLSRLFKVDADTFIITSVSAICSPPFVPVVAGGLRNREIVLSGLTTGIIGYAIGNYLGISLAYILKTFG